jgi:hypothetical protein
MSAGFITGRILDMRAGKRAWLAAALAATAMLGSGCGAERVPAVKKWGEYHGKDGQFSCQYPKTWEATGGGSSGHGYSWAKFKRGGALIEIRADFKGSIMGDIGKSFGGGDQDAEKRALLNLHEMGKKEIGEEEFSGYKEKKPVEFQAGFGDGYKSEFTAAGSFGGKTHGYRATTLSNDRRITVLCTCPESNWKTLKPAFDKVIASVKR